MEVWSVLIRCLGVSGLEWCFKHADLVRFLGLFDPIRHDPGLFCLGVSIEIDTMKLLITKSDYPRASTEHLFRDL